MFPAIISRKFMCTEMLPGTLSLNYNLAPFKSQTKSTSFRERMFKPYSAKEVKIELF